MRLCPVRQDRPEAMIPVTKPINRSVSLMSDAMPPRSGGMMLIDTFAVSLLSNPAPHPVTTIPIATTA
jgi:hypothetical protein